MLLLEWLAIWWVYWPAELILAWIVYCQVDDDHPEWAGFWSALALLLVWGHFRVLPHWTTALWVVGIYLAVGFFVSLYKYLTILWDFRINAPEALTTLSLSCKPGKDSDEIARGLQQMLNLPPGSVTYYTLPNSDPSTASNKPTYRYHINYAKCGPIVSWWIYWPFYALSVVFDPICRFVKMVFNWIKGFYNHLSKAFSVKM